MNQEFQSSENRSQTNTYVIGLKNSHEERLNVTGKMTRMTSGVWSRVPGIQCNSNA